MEEGSTQTRGAWHIPMYIFERNNINVTLGKNKTIRTANLDKN